ncbi:MAG: DNA cytosine methyltransferase [Opitutaceae bacterium]|nr:DNA cytosine methyltransferase [Opitutaceae bacterium]
MSYRIADLFCGAGGTSTGAVEALEALGHRVSLTAINHWDVAVATHTENHPGARHFCASLDALNPKELFKEGELDLLWASPECTHHSRARGGKPMQDQSRATAWCVTRWAEALRPRTIMVENVPEFLEWGPLGAHGKPLKSKKGVLFQAWKQTLEAIGYKVDHRIFCAADYGDPTTRRRLFVQCQLGKRRIIWPDPTHSSSKEPDLFGSRKPWVAAREIIDWAKPGHSIFERKRPLSPKTMKRIWAGLEKFGLKPFIVPQQSNPTPKSTSEPLPTVTAEGSGPKLVEPFIVAMEHGGHLRSVDVPLNTISTAKGGAHAIAQAFLVPQHSSNGPRSVDSPAPTVTTTSRGVGLAQPYLVKLRGTNDGADIEKPAPTVTAGGQHLALAQPFLIDTAHAGERKPLDLNAPLPTVAGNRGAQALVEPHLLPQHGGGVVRPVSEPAPTIATAGAVGLVEPFLVNYYGTGHADSINDPLAAVTTKERHALVRPVVVVNGERYLLDIRFRMLQPHELAAAQGFRRDYKFAGNKTQVVKQIGNAVPRNLARALVLAAVGQEQNVAQHMERFAA